MEEGKKSVKCRDSEGKIQAFNEMLSTSRLSEHNFDTEEIKVTKIKKI